MVVNIVGYETGLFSEDLDQGYEADFRHQQMVLTIFNFPPSFYLTCHFNLSGESCLLCGQMALDESECNEEGFCDVSRPLHGCRGHYYAWLTGLASITMAYLLFPMGPFLQGHHRGLVVFARVVSGTK